MRQHRMWPTPTKSRRRRRREEKVIFSSSPRINLIPSFVPTAPYQSRHSKSNKKTHHLSLSKEDGIIVQPKLKGLFIKSETSKPLTTTTNNNNNQYGPILLPFVNFVNQYTNGWGLSYADLRPETPQTFYGRTFLATNLCFGWGGYLLCNVEGEYTLGIMTELAGLVSFWYHYSQLKYGVDDDGVGKDEVRLALVCDYLTAGTALLTGLIYVIQMSLLSSSGGNGIMAAVPPPMEIVEYGGLAIGCLLLSWVWEYGYPYMFWHGLWHLFSSYVGYLVGVAHSA